MKIQVWVGGDVFVFCGSQAQVQELIKAAVLVVFGETEKRYSLVDSLDLPITVPQHLQTYKVVQGPSLPTKHIQRGTIYETIKPNLCFDDEVSLPRTKPNASALSALCESTGLSEELIETLFVGCEAIRMQDEQMSRREVYIDLSGRVAWGFAGKCLGRELLKELRVEDMCLWVGSRAFRLVVAGDMRIWSQALTLDIPGFTYFLRSFERRSILQRWSP